MKTNTQKRSESPLSFSSITKHHGETRAVGPLSLQIEAGQSVALLGHNGSGKSTLLALAAGLLEASDGSVTVFGEPAGEQAARAAVSYIRDNPVLYEDLSLREQLEYLTRLHGSEPEAHDVDQLIERLGLSSRVDDLPSTLSRGLRQKAAIAVALCRPFALLLVDEPFAGLDPAGQIALLDILEQIRNDNGSVVVATHDHRMLSRFDRALVLSDGQLVYDGPVAEIPPEHRPLGT